MSDPAEKLNDLLPLSPDHNAGRLAELKRLFPDLFTNEGRLNVDELKKVVDPKLVSETERYDFRWYGKTASKREAFTPSRAALVCDKARSVNPAKAGGNMIIEGENLEVLKLLSSSYRERIKCIYIDPPYNTGKDFVYSDRFSEGQKPYWAQTGVTEDGVKVDTNTESDGRFHSNWLSMMHSRLLVARYLLRTDGVIFVSIDDHELHNLRRVMDEVFGEENLFALLVRRAMHTVRNTSKDFNLHADYILAYARDKSWFAENPDRYIRQIIDKTDNYPLDAGDDRGPYKLDPLYARNFYTPYTHTFRNGMVWRAPEGSYPRYSEKTLAAYEDDNRLAFDKGDIKAKRYLKEVQEGQPPNTILAAEDVGFNSDGTRQLREVLCTDKTFTQPKPVQLVSFLMTLLRSPDALVLDFFGGSGTTAQAVMELNKADGGNRQFILVQLPEATAADSPAHKAGFKKISDITIERAKRVIARIQKEAEGLLPNDAQRQFADGLGFNVFKLGKSHFPRVEFAPDPDKTEAENIELLKQYIRDKEATLHIQWERETVLDEVLLKNGFMLDYTLTPRPEFKKNEVFLAKDAHKESLICLDATLAPETVDHFKKHPEHFFICLELALDTTKKWNLKHHLGDKLKAF